MIPARRPALQWNFTSAATGAESTQSLPLIQLDYGVDTDTAGRADRRAELTVTASHLPGTTAAIGKLSLKVSYDDGRTWHTSDLPANRPERAEVGGLRHPPDHRPGQRREHRLPDDHPRLRTALTSPMG
ncbi:hypothetical protein [Streptomyces sp. NPDC001222]|uniref:hypothetical protein n=1 Tax=Streptomyces sp. NPDC001222 TaxID=3364548 RepID=UPI00369CE026